MTQLHAHPILMKFTHRHFRYLVALGCVLGGGGMDRSLAETVSFSREIRPIISNICLQCHGPDDKGRKGGLQLDERETALRGGKSGRPAFIEGQPAASEIIRRLRSTDPDEMMPPPAVKKSVSAAQITLVEQWIAEGAKYEKHWAFQAPTLPNVPGNDAAGANPIDHFVQAKLAEMQLGPTHAADRTSLLRRVSIDLTGLQPTPQELASFSTDPSPKAYERVVDRLLAAPQYGERWARKWLDLARYADTNGYEKDRPRSIWPYRDWVIRALNADLPFDQFTIAQIAGDLLPQPTTDQLVATGFHRNTMLNEEGGIDPLEFRFNAMTDRVGTTGATWLGLTLQCCQCHTHKYDPILQRDYYGIMAFLNNADEPDLEIPDAERTRQNTERATQADRLLTDLSNQWPVPEVGITWITPPPVVSTQPTELNSVLPDGSVLSLTAGLERVTTELIFGPQQGKFSQLRLEALMDPALSKGGPGRAENGNFVVSEIELSVDGQPVKLSAAHATEAQPGFPGAAAIDGNPATGWAVDVPGKEIRQNHAATFTLQHPVENPRAIQVAVKQLHGAHHTIGRLRISLGSPMEAEQNLTQNRATALQAAFTKWLDEARSTTPNWIILQPADASSNSPYLTIEPNGIVFANGDITKTDTYKLHYTNVPPQITSVRLEALPDTRLPAHGPGMGYYEGPKGDFFLGEFQLATHGDRVPLASGVESYAKNNFGQPVSAQLAIDGNPETGWSCAEGQGRAHEAIFRLATPLTTDTLELTMLFGRHYACSLGKFRISITTQQEPAAASTLTEELQAMVRKTSPTADERQQLHAYFLMTAPELATERKAITDLRKPLLATTSLVMQERPAAFPRKTFLHNRGEFTQPTMEVTPSVMKFLHPLPPEAPQNRLTFARWLVSKENPLTARVVVNRAWAAFFGRGIVKTQEDFGYQSDPPSHPELLDWLAVNFMETGWSFKKLHRLIVTSQTYRQASTARAEAAEFDSENKWLWRGPRLRLESEAVRDTALAAAGLLSGKMYGPSVYPPQPASVTEGTYGGFTWEASQGEDRYRRTIYTFAKRTTPYAFSNTFDAPSGAACQVRRDMSNTPLQALTLLNDVTMAEAAQALGGRLATFNGNNAERITEAYLRCLARHPSTEELATLETFYLKQEAHFTITLEAAQQMAGKGNAATAPARAAWTAVARALMNLDEFVTKN